jgi:hypothetical protein
MPFYRNSSTHQEVQLLYSSSSWDADSWQWPLLRMGGMRSWRVRQEDGFGVVAQ